MPNYDLGAAITDAPSAAPTLSGSPALALDVAQSADPTASAPAVAQAALTSQANQSAQDHAATYNSGGLFSKVAGWIGKGPVGTVLNYLNKPLNEVQRDYKFIHALWADPTANAGEAFLATLGIVGGGVIGSAFGPVGIALGADIAGALERNTLGRMSNPNSGFGQAFAESNNANAMISPGRDLANLLGLHNTNSGWGKTVSGIGDAGFDLTMDPMIKAGKLNAVIRHGDLISQPVDKVAPIQRIVRKYYLSENVPALQNFFRAHSIQALDASQTALAYDAQPAFRNAVQHIATLNAPGDIARYYPDLAEVAPQLSKMSDVTQVRDFFVNSMWQDGFWKNMSSSTLPQRYLARVPFQKMLDSLKSAGEADTTNLTPGTLAYKQATNERAYQPNLFTPHSAPNPEGEGTISVPSVFQNLVHWGTGRDPAVGGIGFKSAVAKKVGTWTTYMPFAVDKQSLQMLAGKGAQFDAKDLRSSASVLYSFARMGMGEGQARAIVTQGMNLMRNLDSESTGLADIRRFKLFLANTKVEVAKAMGVGNDSDLMKQLQGEIAKADGLASDGAYGYGYVRKGAVSDTPLTNPDGTVRADGPTLTAAIFPYQTSTKFTLPDFMEMKNAIRQANKYTEYYGKADSWVTHYLLIPFKQAALATGGFALRVSASELLPELMRNGAWNTLRGAVARQAADMNYKLVTQYGDTGAGEADDILSAMMHLVSTRDLPEMPAALKAPYLSSYGSIVRSADRLINSEWDRKIAAHIVISGGGHFTTAGAVSAAHSGANDLLEQQNEGAHQAANKLARNYGHANPEWASLRPGDQNFDGYWLTHLQKLSQDKATQAILKDYQSIRDANPGLAQDDIWRQVSNNEADRIANGADAPPGDPYRYERQVMIRTATMTPEEQAFNRTDAIRGQLVGSDSTIHDNLIAKMANGQKPLPADIKDLRREQLPEGTIGHVHLPYIGKNVMSRIMNAGYRNVIDPIMQHLSRNPIWFSNVKNEMNATKYLVDHGYTDFDTAMRVAKWRAAHAMLPQIHNTALRSQFAILARNALPFYFAQEQAFRRAGHLILEYPQAFRDYQLMNQAINNPGFVSVDDQGNRRLVLPFSGALGAGVTSMVHMLGAPFGMTGAVTGLPVTSMGNIASLQTVLPEFVAPGLSPMVSIPMNMLGNMFPDVAPMLAGVEGRSAGQSVMNELIPNSILRNAWQALDPNEQSTAYANAAASALAAAYYHGDFPDANNQVAQQAFQDRIKNNARSILLMKMILSAVSPLSPSVSAADMAPGNITLTDEFYKIQKQPKYQGDYIGALHAFLAEHGDKAISYTIAKSKSTVPGSYTPLTDQAFQWINSNGDLINKLPAAATFLMPQNGQQGNDSQIVYDELLKLGLRARRTPQEFMNAIYVAAGNNAISQAEIEHKQMQKQYATDPAALQAENQRWAQYIQGKIVANPIWGADYQSPVRTQTANLAYYQLQQAFKAGIVPDTPQSQIISELMQQYQNFSQSYAATGTGYGNSATRKMLKDQWNQYLTEYGQAHPEAQTAIRSLFSRLAA